MPKAALAKIDDTKRERIFAIAAEEFARNGFHGANVGAVAERAGIAKGAVYLYFDSKLDLYRETLRAGAEVLDALFASVAERGGSIRDQLHILFLSASDLVRHHPDVFRMYCDLSTSSDPDLIDIAPELETGSARFYRGLIADGQARGEVRHDLPAPMLAVLLDSTFLSVLSGQACGYQGLRLREFGVDEEWKVQAQVRAVLDFVSSGIAPPHGVEDAPHKEESHE